MKKILCILLLSALPVLAFCVPVGTTVHDIQDIEGKALSIRLDDANHEYTIFYTMRYEYWGLANVAVYYGGNCVYRKDMVAVTPKTVGKKRYEIIRDDRFPLTFCRVSANVIEIDGKEYPVWPR